MKKKFLSIPFIILAITVSFAQKLLTADEAVSIALKNNYDILVAHNDAQIAKVNNTPGNAGMLPVISATGADNYSLASGAQKPAAAPETNYSNVGSSVFSAGVALNWTLFDGGKMFVTKKRLGEIDSLGDIQFRSRVLQTVYSVTVAYYNVVQQKQQLASINEVLAYNKERVTILQTSFGAGLSPKTTLLQAQIDLNVYKESALAQEGAIRTAKRALNLLLCRDAAVAFETGDSIPLAGVPDRQRLFEKLNSANLDIRAFQKQMEVARLSLQEARTLLFPRINLTGGYFGAQTENPAGSVTLSRTYGPQVAGGITVPLFQAGNAARQIAAARLQLKSSEYDLQNMKLQAAAQLMDALDDFEVQSRLLQIENDNDALAKENLDISMQRLRLGQSTSLELRLAQDSYEESRTRLINIKFHLKAAETKLRQLVAEL